MSRLLSSILLALGGGAVAGTGYLIWRRARDEVGAEGEPAPPIETESSAAPVVATGPSSIPSNENEVEALARVIASEAGSGTRAEQRAIAWTVRNRFQRRGKSIYAVQYPWRSQKGSNPPFSSARDAKGSHRALAREVLAADQSEDPTGGATSFFEPRMQDAFFQAGVMARRGEAGNRNIDGVPLTNITRFKYYKYDANGIRKRWSKGSTVYATAGRFEFWGSTSLFARRGGTVQNIVAGALSDAITEHGGGPVPIEVYGEDDEESLARAVESSVPSGTDGERLAVAWAVRNRARRLCVPVTLLVAPVGEHGPRGTGGRAFVSSAREGGARARDIARHVLAQRREQDPTSGAIDFWKPAQQRQLATLALAHAVAIENGDEAAAEALAPFTPYGASEDETRAGLLASGLRVRGVVGDIELLGE